MNAGGSKSRSAAIKKNRDGRDIAIHLKRVMHRSCSDCHLRLHAQVVMSGRNRGNHGGVRPAALAPTAITITSVVIAGFPTEVIGFAVLFIDQRKS